MRPRPVHATAAEARAARLAQNRQWHQPYVASSMPWRVVYDGDIVAVFVHERDARGFALARYRGDAVIEARVKGRRRRSPLRVMPPREPAATLTNRVQAMAKDLAS